jgi:1-phosphatidylinositol phosphodiesterase
MRSLLALALLTASCTIVQSAPGTPGYVSSGSATLELNVDRPGSDYRSFDLGSPRPEECRDTCMVEPQCVAFTYVNPGVQGPSARCWLKNSVPPPSASNCCVSGVKNAPPAMAGGDYQGQPAGAPPAAPPEPPPSSAGPPPQYAAPPPQYAGPPPQYAAPPPVQDTFVGRPPAAPRSLEVNVNRPGGDIANFDLPEARPHLCREACMRDGRCLAFTYVNPGVQGPRPRCWLKGSVPPPVADGCCTSGVKGGRFVAPVAGSPFEPNVDRPGSDFQNFDLPQARPELCRDACLREGQCRAFTYVNPGFQGPNPRCWLKTSVPQANPSNCCISGVK